MKLTSSDFQAQTPFSPCGLRSLCALSLSPAPETHAQQRQLRITKCNASTCAHQRAAQRVNTLSPRCTRRIGVYGVSFIGSRDSQRTGSGGIPVHTMHRNSTTRARRPFVNKRLCFRTTAACCKTMSAHSTAARSGSKEHGHESCVALWSPLVRNMAQALRLRSRALWMCQAPWTRAHIRNRGSHKNRAFAAANAANGRSCARQ